MPILTFAQKPSLRIGAQFLRSVHLELDLSIGEKKTIGTRVSRYFRLTGDEYQVYGFLALNMLFTPLHQSGNGYGVYYGFQPKNNDWFWQFIQLEYRHMKSGNYIADEGYSGGSVEAPYTEYTEELRDIAISYKSRMLLFPYKKLEFICETGFIYSLGERKYTVEGTYDSQRPSDKVEIIKYIWPFLRAGLNFKLF